MSVWYVVELRKQIVEQTFVVIFGNYFHRQGLVWGNLYVSKSLIFHLFRQINNSELQLTRCEAAAAV